GATVLLNSHILSEIEITCDRVVFIKEGEVVASRDLRAFPDAEVGVVARARNLSTQTIAGLSQWSTSARLDGERLTLTTHSTSVLPDILRYLTASGSDIFEFTPQRLSLEDFAINWKLLCCKWASTPSIYWPWS